MGEILYEAEGDDIPSVGEIVRPLVIALVVILAVGCVAGSALICLGLA